MWDHWIGILINMPKPTAWTPQSSTRKYSTATMTILPLVLRRGGSARQAASRIRHAKRLTSSPFFTEFRRTSKYTPTLYIRRVRAVHTSSCLKNQQFLLPVPLYADPRIQANNVRLLRCTCAAARTRDFGPTLKIERQHEKNILRKTNKTIVCFN